MGLALATCQRRTGRDARRKDAEAPQAGGDRNRPRPRRRGHRSAGALDHALCALKLLPDFVPAALIAARIQSNRGEARKAMSLLRRVWRATSHPDVATLYANAQPGASAVDRLKRVRELIDTPPPNRAAAIVLARAAIDAYDWAAARNALANYSVAEPTQAVCLLMAEIEEGQNADQGKAREWLARAVRAPRDPVWTADGVTATNGSRFPRSPAARCLRVASAGQRTFAAKQQRQCRATACRPGTCTAAARRHNSACTARHAPVKDASPAGECRPARRRRFSSVGRAHHS